MFALSLVTMLWYVGADIYADVKLEDLGESYDAASHDFSLYINNTVKQIEHLTDDNYLEFEAFVEEEIQEGVDEFDVYIQDNIVGGTINVQELSEILNATNDVIEMYGGGDQVVGSLLNVQTTTNAYADSADALKADVDVLSGSAALTSLIDEAAGYDTTDLEAYRDLLVVNSDLARAIADAAASLPPLQISQNDMNTLITLEEDIATALSVS